MPGIMETISSIITSLGPSVFIPIVLFILSLVFKVPIGKAFRAALMVGVGFVGINMVIGFFLSQLAPITRSMVEVTGIRLEYIDVGWPSSAGIAFATLIGSMIIPITVIVNFLMLAARLTRTIDIDVWNYWHFAFTGSMVYAATGDLWLAILASIVNIIIVLKLADWNAPMMQKALEMPGVSFPTTSSISYILFGVPVKWLVDKTPLKNIKADPETIQKRLGVLGEPAVLGLIIGIILAILAKASLIDILKTGVMVAGIMVILPRIVRILMEGLLPISEGIREWFRKRLPGREFYLGLDSAIATGHPSAIASGLILIPISLVLSVILYPYNRILILTDLPALVFAGCLLVGMFGGNIIHIIIACTLGNIVGFLLGTDMAPAFTAAAKSVGWQIPEGYIGVSSWGDGMMPLPVILWEIFVRGGYIACITLLILAIVGSYIYERRLENKNKT